MSQLSRVQEWPQIPEFTDFAGVNSWAKKLIMSLEEDAALRLEELAPAQISNYSIILGVGAGENNNINIDSSEGIYNVFIGHNAGYTNSTGQKNIAIGYKPLYANTTGSENIALGSEAAVANTTGNYNIAIGDDALLTNTTGQQNIAIGYKTLEDFNNTGSAATNNVAVGFQSLLNATTCTDNVAIGTNAVGSGIATGADNVAIGSSALYSNTSGTENVAIGKEALYTATTGDNNTAIGKRALYSLTTVNDNTAIGHDALYTNTIGITNVAVGGAALYFNTEGFGNVAIGLSALYKNTTSDGNVAIGYEAGHENTTAGSNVFIGYQAGYSETGGNKLYIANSNTATPLIGGVFPNTSLTFTSAATTFSGTLTSTGTVTIPTALTGVIRADSGVLSVEATAILDADFGSAGLCATDGAGTYSIVADASANWNTAYGWGDHAGANSDITSMSGITGTIATPTGITMSDGGTVGNATAYINFDGSNSWLEITGKVGIGTGSPSSLTHLYHATAAELRLQVTDSPYQPTINFYSGSGAGTHQATIFASGTTGEIRIGSVHASYFPTFYSANAEAMRIDTSGGVYIGDTANANMTIGLTINQAGNDDEIFALKSSDVAHGVTGYAETDTYATFEKTGNDSGGVDFYGFTELVSGIRVFAIATNDNTDKDATANAPVYINASKKNGTSIAAVGADANLVCIGNDLSTRFIFDEDGDMFYDGAAPANYDQFDDALACRDLSMVLSKQFNEVILYNKEKLTEMGVLRPFVSTKALNMLELGAIGQLYERNKKLEAKVNALEKRLEA